METSDHPTNFLDFVDWLNRYTDQQRAVVSLLCWIDHSLSADELRELSVLLEHLADDLKQKTEQAYQAWREREGRDGLFQTFEETARRVRHAPPGADTGYRDLEDAALLLRVREKTRNLDGLCDLLDRFLSGQIDREATVSALQKTGEAIEDREKALEGRPVGVNIDVFQGKPWPKKALTKPTLRRGPRAVKSGTATTGRKR